MVTVGDLKKLLEHYSDDLPIILSSDSEGNWYSPLYDVAERMYLMEGEIYQTNEQIDTHMGTYYTEEDRAPKDAFKVVALWP